MNVGMMIDSHPKTPAFDKDKLAACIDAAAECVISCSLCSDACLSEDNPAKLRNCIVSCADCADVCSTTVKVLARMTEKDQSVATTTIEACRAACEACANTCREHAEMHAHCKQCAEICQTCADACKTLLQ